MTKTKTAFFCQNCGMEHLKWIGQCTHCKKWNMMIESVVSKKEKKPWKDSLSKKVNLPLKINEIKIENQPCYDAISRELNSVLGNGIVPGSVILLSGEPGIGKSTLLLQIALSMPYEVLYVSGEESLTQIKLRANRIKNLNKNCAVLAETNTQRIFEILKNEKPKILIIDSIQTLHTNCVENSAGSIVQIRETASEIIKFAKETETAVIIIGHINKDGHIAGPKILEHMVDVILQFEGDKNNDYRILRALKNRFGSTQEMGIYQMKNNGLKEVRDPSSLLISKRDNTLSGTVIAAIMEGIRPLMIEIQSLVSTAVYGIPQRSSTGYALKRLYMILAVLEKRAGFKLESKDVFLNVTGGISIEDPAIDLAVVTAILSSNEDKPIHENLCFAAEIGLTGEIRPAKRTEQRIIEAEKLGFEKIFVSKFCKFEKRQNKIEVVKMGKIENLISILF